VTATESNHRKGLTPWWRTRSWSRDLDTLSRLHKGLRALDADEEAEPLAAPVRADPASGPDADQDSRAAAPAPDADGEAAQPDDQPPATAGEQEEQEEQDKPEAAPAPDTASDNEPCSVPAPQR
jgi:hypothetical protein